MRRLAALLGALACLPSAALAASGSPDATFGAGGTVVSPVGTADAVVIQPGGRIVTGGESYDGRGGHPLTLAAYSVGGALDTGFGRSGVATAPATGLAGLAIGPAGGIVAAGYRTRAGRREPALARFTASGALEGVTAAPVGDGDAVGRAVAVAGDGSVFVACDAVRAGVPVIAVVHYSPAGSVRDTAFVGIPGRAVTAAGIAVDTGGAATVAGTEYDPTTATSAPVVARLLSGGAPDPRFGGGAPVVVRTEVESVQVRAMALGADGGVVVAGSGRVPLRSGYLAVRLAADGSLDASFGAAGVVVLPVGSGDAYATGVALDPTGAVVLAGDSSGGAALLRLGPDGALDPAFTAAAAPLLPYEGSDSRPTGLAVDSEGRLVLAGSAFTGARRQLTLARYASGG